MGYTEMSLDMVPKGSLAQLNLDQVLKAANRAKDLVRQILLFSRRGEQERQPLLIMSTIKEALKLLRASLPATVEIRRIVTAHPDIQILGDPTQIHQVMLNLCTNAAHAMREKGGTLDVEVAEEVLSAADLASEPELRPGSYVRLTVRDTGHGIERQVLDRIFEPFFTTKEPFEGTGMGLAVVHGIVKGHEGFIRVSSEVGKGTGFDLYFPKFANARAPRDSDALEIPRGRGRILFVDDEAALTRLAREMLESLGYEVTVENGAFEALETFEGRPNAFDLIITDYTMPRMTGLELAGAILAIRPEIPVILCSGYSDMISEEKIREAGIREFIMKPVGLREMADALRRLLH
jgi:two-component system cell cycle sensor histidine kinase/response regulator CckA